MYKLHVEKLWQLFQINFFWLFVRKVHSNFHESLFLRSRMSEKSSELVIEHICRKCLIQSWFIFIYVFLDEVLYSVDKFKSPCHWTKLLFLDMFGIYWECVKNQQTKTVFTMCFQNIFWCVNKNIVYNKILSICT